MPAPHTVRENEKPLALRCAKKEAGDLPGPAAGADPEQFRRQVPAPPRGPFPGRAAVRRGAASSPENDRDDTPGSVHPGPP